MATCGVEVAHKRLVEAASTLEPVSRVLHFALAVLRKGLKAPRPKAELRRAYWYSGVVCVCNIVVDWGGSWISSSSYSIF